MYPSGPRTGPVSFFPNTDWKNLLNSQAIFLAPVTGETSTINGKKLDFISDRDLQSLLGASLRKLLIVTAKNLTFACLIFSQSSVLSKLITDFGCRDNRRIRFNFCFTWISLVIHGLFFFFFTLSGTNLAIQSRHILLILCHKTFAFSCLQNAPQGNLRCSCLMLCWNSSQ